MDIKQFTVGQTAYLIGEGNRKEKERGYTEVKVVKVGRTYVTTQLNSGCWERRFHTGYNDNDPYLIEKVTCGSPCFLFPTIEAFNEYTEYNQLKDKLRRAFEWCNIGKLTLNQLRAVNRILEGDEQCS